MKTIQIRRLTARALLGAVLLIGSLLVPGCAPRTPVSPNSVDLSKIRLESGCSGLTTVIKHVDNRTGTVYYNSFDKVYMIRYHYPGTYDSVDFGVTCNLPAELQVDGAKITFDGDYLSLDRKLGTPQPVGYSYYYLRLTKVRLFTKPADL